MSTRSSSADADPLRCLRVVLMVGLSLLGEESRAQFESSRLEATYWGQRSLTIPYRWAGQANSSSVSHVVLYYTSDNGRNWQVASNAAPHVQSFVFNAPGDGRFGFAVRTYDRNGSFHPAGALRADMRVVVDTVAPRVERLDGALEDGAVAARIVVRDEKALTRDEVRLYATVEGRGAWVPVELTEESLANNAGVIRMVGRWSPPVPGAAVLLRVTVRDRAGNHSEQTARVEGASAGPVIARAASPWSSPGLAPPDHYGPSTGGAPGPGAAAIARNAALDPFAAAEAAHPRPTPPARPTPHSLTGASRALAETQDKPSQPWPSEPRRSKSFFTSVPATAPAQREDGGRSPFSTASLSPRGPSDTRPAGAGAGAFDRFSDQSAKRIVNSTEFEFDYDLTKTGRWGVAKVELWGSDNGGRSWRRMAIDSDRQSPIRVSTPGEGEYGFRMVVESVGGLEARVPLPGEAPEATVVVDLQKPRVGPLRVEQGSGYFADQLLIEWRADDENPAPQPIDLFYSDRPTGPWAPIATSLDNSGRYSWRLQRHLPSRMYVRLEVRDRAGNTSTITTPEALAIETPHANGSLRGVRAARSR